MRRTLLLGGVFCTALAALPAQTAADPAAAFDTDLKNIQALAKRSQWKPAADRLAKLLASADIRDAARARREEILALDRAAAFHVQFPSPDPKTLISGELLSWNTSSGSVKLRYVPDKMDDWVSQGTLRMHPAKFVGPHRIEIKGQAYPGLGGDTVGPRAVVCSGKVAAYDVHFGIAAESTYLKTQWIPCSLARLTGAGPPTKLDSKEQTACRPKKPFTLRVIASDPEITASYNGRDILSGRREKADWGFTGISSFDFDEIKLEGLIEASWLQQKVDKVDQEHRALFDKAYDAKASLPAWLFEAASAAPQRATAADEAEEKYPEPLTEDQSPIADRVAAMIAAGKIMDAWHELNADSGKSLPTATRQLLLGMCNLAGYDMDKAIEHCDNALKTAPKSSLVRATKARALHLIAHTEEAAVLFKQLATEFPRRAGYTLDAGTDLMLAGHLAEAKAILDASLKRGVTSTEIDKLNRMIVRAQNGPDWATTHESNSQNFSVSSDISRQMCEDAAKALEDSYAAYSAFFDRVKDSGAKRFRVFLFAGRDGYDAYCRDVLGSSISHTAGLYSGATKQLLIWNLPERAAMMRTIRHEGFHQYLDRVMRNPPTWFNEGMAMYLETAQNIDGQWRFGEVRKDLLATLGGKFIPIAKFMREPRAAFYGTLAPQHYAQGWALCHYLQHSTPEEKARFKKFWKLLADGSSGRAAVEAMFPESTADDFDEHFQTYLQKLSGG